MAQNSPPTGPLTEAEITGALQLSGYPLEIRLLQTFTDAGLDPSIGHRFIVGGHDQSCEVDVIVRARESLEGHAGQVHLTALIEAKQLIERRVFVGFKWRQPSTHEMRVMRCRLSGRPTCRVVSQGLPEDELVQMMLAGASPVGGAFDGMNEAPVCPQWAYVQDNKDTSSKLQHKFVASQDKEHRKSFGRLVEATTWLEENSADFLTRTPGKPPMLRVEIISPTIVFGTPSLYMYDPITRALEETDHLILQQMWDAGGQVHVRYVDVVTEGGVTNMITRYKAALALMLDRCNGNIGALQRLANEQRLAQIEIDSEDAEGRQTVFTT
jgi:hypothetical protein